MKKLAACFLVSLLCLTPFSQAGMMNAPASGMYGNVGASGIHRKPGLTVLQKIHALGGLEFFKDFISFPSLNADYAKGSYSETYTSTSGTPTLSEGYSSTESNDDVLSYEISGNRSSGAETVIIGFTPNADWVAADREKNFLTDTDTKSRRIYHNASGEFVTFAPNFTDSNTALSTSLQTPLIDVPMMAVGISYGATEATNSALFMRELSEDDDATDYTEPSWGSKFYIGCDASGANQLNGKIRFVIIFNRALTSEEIETIALLMEVNRNYYVATTGDDNATGRNPSVPWATISKVTELTQETRGNIFFNRSNEWRPVSSGEFFTIPAIYGTEKSNIIIGAYGEGSGTLGAANRPLFTGSVTATDLSQNWTNHSGSIWKISGVDWTVVNAVLDVTDINRKYTAETVGSPVYGGVGKNDLNSTITGSSTGYNAYVDASYTVEIVSTGTPDVWKWKKDSGSWSSNINMVSGQFSPQSLSDNVSVWWGSTTGHTAGDSWTIGATAKVTIGGTLRSVASTGAMVRGTYYFSAATDTLYVWTFDNRAPGEDEIFIGKAYHQYRGLITTKKSSNQYIRFQDLELRFSNNSGLTIAAPHITVNRVFSHHHSGNGFGTVANTGTSTKGNNISFTDCWSSFCSFGSGVGASNSDGSGTSQPFTFEGDNNWAIRCISSWGYKAGFDFLSYNSQTTASGGLIDSFSYRNGWASDPGIYVDGGHNVQIINTVSIGAGYVVNGPDVVSIGWNRNALWANNENPTGSKMETLSVVNCLLNGNGNVLSLSGSDAENYYIYGNTSVGGGNSAYTSLFLSGTTGVSPRVYYRGNIATGPQTLGRSLNTATTSRYYGNYNIHKSGKSDQSIFQIVSSYKTMAQWQALLTNGAGYQDENSIGGGNNNVANPRFVSHAGYTFFELLVGTGGKGLDETALVDYGSYFLDNVADGGANTSPAIDASEANYYANYIEPFGVALGTTSVTLAADSGTYDIGYHYHT